LFLSFFIRGEAILTIHAPPQHAGKVFETMHFKYYGKGDAIYNGSTMIFDDREICATQGHPVVHDTSWLEQQSIIRNTIALNPSPICEPFSTYDALLKNGNVLALVEIGSGNFLAPYPEYDVYEHSSWNSCEHCSSGMILVGVPDPDGTLAALALSEGANLKVQLSPPHNSETGDTYSSVWWVLLVRVLCPFVSFMTAVSAWFQLNKNVSSWSVRDVFCTVELVQSIVMGTMFALGQGGPQLLPNYIYGGCARQLLGHSVSGALILAFFLYEKRNIRTGESRKPLFVEHRLKILTGLIFFIGVDFVTFGVSIGGYYTRALYNGVLLVGVLIGDPIEIVALVYYLINVRYFLHFSDPLLTQNALM
jgi:hypothetical protein